MPVTNQTPIIAYTANGVSVAFAFPFLLDQPSDLIVTVSNAVKLLGIDYSIAGTGIPAGGTVTFSSPPLNGERVVLARRTALQRLTDYQTGGDNRANVLDADLDRLWLALQDGWLGVQSSIRYQNGDSGPTRMPMLVDGQVLGQLGNELVGRDLLPSGGAVNFIQIGEGAVGRSIQDKAREWVSIFDWLSPSEIADVQSNAATIDLSQKIAACFAVNKFVMFPPGTYLGLMLKPQSGTTLMFLNATLKLTPNAPKYNRVLDFQNVNDICVFGVLNINGNRFAQTNIGNVGQDGILITDESSNIYIQRANIYDCSEDGIMINSWGDATKYPKNIHIESAYIKNCGRNNVSITAGDGIRIGYLNTSLCKRIDGLGPGDGIDIEPNGSEYVCRNISIGAIYSTENEGRGVSILGHLLNGAYNHSNVTIEYIYSAKNARDGIAIENVENVKISHSVCENNGVAVNGQGVYIFGSAYNISLPSAVCRNNFGAGIYIDLGDPKARCGKFDFSGARLYDNNLGNSNRAGINIVAGSAFPILGVNFDRTDFTCSANTKQSYGISVNSTVNLLDVSGFISSANNVVATLNAFIPGIKTKSRGVISDTLTPGSIPANGSYVIPVNAPAGTCVVGDVAICRPMDAAQPGGIVFSCFCETDRFILTIHNGTASPVTPAPSRWFFESMGTK